MSGILIGLSQMIFLVFRRWLKQVLFPVYVLALTAYFGKSIYLYFSTRFFEYRERYRRFDDCDLLVCRHCRAQFRLRFYGNKRNNSRRSVFCFDLFLREGAARKNRENLRTLSHNWLIFLATLWFFAYAEELVWNRGVWHERNWLFGANWNFEEWKIYLVPLLAVPQLTHYVLDGFIWRRKRERISS